MITENNENINIICIYRERKTCLGILRSLVSQLVHIPSHKIGILSKEKEFLGMIITCVLNQNTKKNRAS